MIRLSPRARRQQARKALGRRAAPRMEALEERQLLTTLINFDPDGPGPVAAREIQGFDFGAGNLLAQGVIPETVGATFPVLYQAKLTGLVDPTGRTVAPPGLNASYEITATAKYTAVVTAVNGDTFSFQLAPTQGAGTGINFFFDSKRDADPLAGTGFDNGSQFLSARPDAALGGAASTFTATRESGLVLANFDGSGADDYAGMQSVVGSGTLALAGDVTTSNANFFVDHVDVLAFTGAIATPFTQVNPSRKFPGNVTPNLGTVNGEDGPDFQLQATLKATAAPASAVIAVAKSVNGQDANQAPGVFVPLGGDLTFSYAVTNPGNLPLSNVAIVDDNGTPGITTDDFIPTFVGGDANGDGMLNPGETWTYSGSGMVANAGQGVNTAKVTAQPSSGFPVSASDPAFYFGNTPGLALVLAINGDDANNPPGPQIQAGTDVNLTYSVFNSGGTALTDVSVIDDNGTPNDPTDDFSPIFTGGDTNGDGKLDVGEAWTYSATTAARAGQQKDLAVVTAHTLDGKQAVSGDEANYFGLGSAIAITKLVNGQHAPTAPGVVVPVGSTVMFSYLVTNAGSVPLTSVTVVDDNGTPADPGDDILPTLVSGDTNGDGKLDVGETWTFTGTHIAAAGLYQNTARANGVGTDGISATASDVGNSLGVQAQVTLTKLVAAAGSASPGQATGLVVPAGSSIVFTYQVGNPGNIALTNVTLTDDNGTPGDASDDFSPTFVSGDNNHNNQIDPGEVWIYSASRTALAGIITNTAVVRAQATGATTPPSASARAAYGGLISGLIMEKDVIAAPLPAQVSLLQRTRGNPNRIVLDFNLPVDPAHASNATLYTLTAPGRDGKFGTRDDQTIRVRSATYNAADRSVALVSAKPLSANGRFLLRVDGSSTAGLVDTEGQQLDGDRDGLVGGDYQRVFGPGDLRGSIVANTPARSLAGAQGEVVAAGTAVTFAYLLANTGNAALTHLTLTDDNGTPGNIFDDFVPAFFGGDTNADGKLDPGEVWTLITTRPAQPGQHTNIASASASDLSGAPLKATATASYFGVSPAVVDVRRSDSARSTTIALTYDRPVNSAIAASPTSYQVVAPGRDGVVGTADDRGVRLSEVVYDSGSSTVTIRTDKRLNPGTRYVLVADSPTPPVSPSVIELSGAARALKARGR